MKIFIVDVFDYDLNKQVVKGFPILDGHKEQAAINWAQSLDPNYIVHSWQGSVFYDMKIEGIVKRSTGASVWKVSMPFLIKGKKIEVLFDLREDELLEIMKSARIEYEVIKTGITVCANSRLAMVGGRLDKDFKAREQAKKQPKLKKSAYIIGFEYSTTPSFIDSYFLIEMDDKGYLFLNSKTLTTVSYESPNFKFRRLVRRGIISSKIVSKQKVTALSSAEKVFLANDASKTAFKAGGIK
jgi:hypothetical protein